MATLGRYCFVVILTLFIGCCSAAKYATLNIDRINLKQGDTVIIKCTLSNAEQGDVIQIIKTKVTSIHPSGTSNISSLVDHIMCNNTILDPDLNKLERYSISGDSGSVQMTITNLQTMDSGTFLCRGMLGEQQYTTNTTEQHIFVTGPIRMVEINSPPIRPEHGYGLAEDSDNSTLRTEVNEDPLDLDSGTEVEMECRVTVDHKAKWPIVEAFVDNEEVSNLIRHEVNHQHSVNYPGYLVDAFNHIYYVWKMVPSLKYDGKNVTCQAHLPDTWPNTVSTQRTLRIATTIPEDGKCEPSYVQAKVGTLEVKLECEALAREEPEVKVMWYGPGEMGEIVSDAEKGYVVETKRNGLNVATSLKVAEVSHLGKYKVVWHNENGETTAEVEIGEKLAPGSASGIRVGIIAFTMIIMLLHI